MDNVCRFCMKYYPHILGNVCPECGGILENIEIDEFEYTRDDSSDSGSSSASESDYEDSFNEDDEWEDEFDDETTVYSPSPKYKRTTKQQPVDRQISGMIINYSEGKEHRFLINKIIDALWYAQCFSDTYYSFVIRNLHSNQTYNVTAYGKISGHGAKPIKDQHVTVNGKISRNGIFFASRMQVDSGSAFSDVIFYNDFERSRPNNGGGSYRPNRYLTHLIFTLIFTLILILGFLYVPPVRNFITTWIFSTIILLAIVSLFFKRTLLNSPSALLALGLVATLVVRNIGGLGSVISSIFAMLGPSVGTIIIMLFGLSLIIKGFKN